MASTPAPRAKSHRRPTSAQADALADALDAMLGIQAHKVAITDPELLQLLRIAGLRKEAARSHRALAGPPPRS